MTMTIRAKGAIFGALALVAALVLPAASQLRLGLVDPNKATEAELAQLPSMTPAIAKTLVDQKLTPAQIKAFYAKAFLPINLDTGTKEEFMLIPGVGARMSAEFAEYRPGKTSVQFDKEI